MSHSSLVSLYIPRDPCTGGQQAPRYSCPSPSSLARALRVRDALAVHVVVVAVHGRPGATPPATSIYRTSRTPLFNHNKTLGHARWSSGKSAPTPPGQRARPGYPPSGEAASSSHPLPGGFRAGAAALNGVNLPGGFVASHLPTGSWLVSFCCFLFFLLFRYAMCFGCGYPLASGLCAFFLYFHF